MLLAVVLLYVGAVLVINGIWLLGTARAAEFAPAPIGGAAVGAEAPLRPSVAFEHNPVRITDQEVAILNIFTGFIGVVCATTLAVQGNANGDLASVRASGFILLFAFTYLWVAYNQYVRAVNGHAFGWYCAFVAITAIAAGVYVIKDADGNTASVWLGIDWFAWSILWGMFAALLAFERPIARITGYVAIIEGIGTAWVFGFLLLENVVHF
jgi:hypothetical protein